MCIGACTTNRCNCTKCYALYVQFHSGICHCKSARDGACGTPISKGNSRICTTKCNIESNSSPSKVTISNIDDVSSLCICQSTCNREISRSWRRPVVPVITSASNVDNVLSSCCCPCPCEQRKYEECTYSVHGISPQTVFKWQSIFQILYQGVYHVLRGPFHKGYKYSRFLWIISHGRCVFLSVCILCA